MHIEKNESKTRILLPLYTIFSIGTHGKLHIEGKLIKSFDIGIEGSVYRKKAR